ncbi:MAG: hypothetical protein ACRDGD_12490 [Candidatus Limnocylindria bacterium]
MIRAIVLATLMLTACAAPGATGPAATSPQATGAASTNAAESPSPSQPPVNIPSVGPQSPSAPAVIGDPPPSGGDLDALVAEVMRDAEERTGVPASEIVVVSAEAVTWSDGSLGCPQPGQVYTQALVPGYRVILDVEGEELSYHADDRGNYRACDNPQPPIETGVDR